MIKCDYDDKFQVCESIRERIFMNNVLHNTQSVYTLTYTSTTMPQHNVMHWITIIMWRNNFTLSNWRNLWLLPILEQK